MAQSVRPKNILKTKRFSGYIDHVLGSTKFISRFLTLISVSVVLITVIVIYAIFVNDSIQKTHFRSSESSIRVIGMIEPAALNFELSLRRYVRMSPDLERAQDLRLKTETLIGIIDLVEDHMVATEFLPEEELAELWSVIKIIPSQKTD